MLSFLLQHRDVFLLLTLILSHYNVPFFSWDRGRGCHLTGIPIFSSFSGVEKGIVTERSAWNCMKWWMNCHCTPLLPEQCSSWYIYYVDMYDGWTSYMNLVPLELRPYCLQLIRLVTHYCPPTTDSYWLCPPTTTSYSILAAYYWLLFLIVCLLITVILIVYVLHTVIQYWLAKVKISFPLMASYWALCLLLTSDYKILSRPCARTR